MRMRRTTAAALALLCSTAAGVPSPASRVLIIDGTAALLDGAQGSREAPLQSVGEAACRAVEQEQQLTAGGGAAQRWTLELRGGDYPSLSEHDLRCFGVGVPLTITAHAGEHVVMSAGVRIPNSALKPSGGSAGQLTVSLPGVAAAGLAVGSYGLVSSCDARVEVSMLVSNPPFSVRYEIHHFGLIYFDAGTALP